MYQASIEPAAADQGDKAMQIKRVMSTFSAHPVYTRSSHLAFETDTLRIEHNLTHNDTTREEHRELRIAPQTPGQYQSITIPVLDDGRLLLLGRYRYAAGCWSMEFPRSQIESDDEGWLSTAQADLLEDTGLTATQLRLLGSLQPDAALMALGCVVILAENCVGLITRPADPRTSIAGAVAVTPEEVDQMVARGEICCGVTLAALTLYRVAQRRNAAGNSP